MASRTTYIDLSRNEGLYENIKLILNRHFGGVETYCCDRQLPDDIFEKFYDQKLSLPFLLALTGDGVLRREEDRLVMPHPLIVQCALIRIQSQQSLGDFMREHKIPFHTFSEYFYQGICYTMITKVLLDLGLYRNAPVHIARVTNCYKDSIVHYYQNRGAQVACIKKRLASLRRQFVMTLDLPTIEAQMLQDYPTKTAFQKAIGVNPHCYWSFFTMKQWSYKIIRYLLLHDMITLDAAAPEVREPLLKYLREKRAEQAALAAAPRPQPQPQAIEA